MTQVAEKVKINASIEDLNNIFTSKSPIPGFVCFNLNSSDEIHLTEVDYEEDVLNTYCDEQDDLFMENRKGLKGEKKQSLFVIFPDDKTWKLKFSGLDCIGNAIAESRISGMSENIQKIVIVTKYRWKTLTLGITKRSDVLIKVINLC